MRKNRILPLLLAAAFILAATAAAAFTDSGDTAPVCLDAVGAMAEAGILRGFPDGGFRPKGTLTREQGAVIVTRAVLGEGAAALDCTGTPFGDVKPERWSAPSVAWCAESGILSGYGDGRFGPADPLTGTQFVKMLLCAFSLGRPEGYTGSGWAEAVWEDGEAAGIFDGCAGVDPEAVLTREFAALMTANALKAAAPERPADEREPLPEPLPEDGTGERTLTPKDGERDPSGALLPRKPADLEVGSPADPRPEEPIIIIPVIPRTETDSARP